MSGLRIIKKKSSKLRFDGSEHSYKYAVCIDRKDTKTGKRIRKMVGKAYRSREDAQQFIWDAKVKLLSGVNLTDEIYDVQHSLKHFYKKLGKLRSILIKLEPKNKAKQTA